MKAVFRWLTSPPQAYVVYAVLVVAIGGLSFWAGTLKPKKAVIGPPAATSQPRE
jgi:hypothetical protein